MWPSTPTTYRCGLIPSARVGNAWLPRCSVPMPFAAFSSMHRGDGGGNEKRRCCQRRSWCTSGPARFDWVAEAVRPLVGPNDLSALEAKQAHGLVVDGVKYVENRQQRCGASWAEHLILFSHSLREPFSGSLRSIVYHPTQAEAASPTS